MNASASPVAVAVFVAIAAGCAADASTDRSLDPRSKPARASAAIIDGAPDESHPAVVSVWADFPEGRETCTGYVIAPDLILTARHCAGTIVDLGGTCIPVAGEAGTEPPAKGGPLLDPAAITVRNDLKPGIKSKVWNVAEVLVPDGSTGAIMCGNDVALLRLAAPTDVAPIVPRLDLPPIVGEPLTAVGYGIVTIGDPKGGWGTRRVRDGLAVEAVGERLDVSPRRVASEWTITEGPCPGDSGGPALDVEGRSIGVMSRGNTKLCKGMVYEGLVVHGAWIRAAVRASAARPGGALPAWIEPPAKGSASRGEACSSIDQCAPGLVCQPVDGHFVCVGPAGGDAGTPPDGAGGETTPAAAAEGGGCRVSSSPRKGHTTASTAALSLLALAAAALVARRRVDAGRSSR
jgi:MYXO-CTERM domain-containing protein